MCVLDLLITFDVILESHCRLSVVNVAATFATKSLLSKAHNIYRNVYYLLGKGGYVFGSVDLSVCLSVGLSVDNITQKVISGLG